MKMSPAVVLMIIGLLFVAIGLIALTGALDWFGHLPGDIRVERGDGRLFIPITSMVVVSVVLSIAVNVVLRLLR